MINKQSTIKHNGGFTIMEIIVATTIFVVIFSALLPIFNYTLEINRRSEALRQASQGMRSFVEYLVKEIRNGQVDYGYLDPSATEESAQIGSWQSNNIPCGNLAPTNPPPDPPRPGYTLPDNKLALINTDGVEECFYYGSGTSYAGNNVFSSSTGATTLVLAQGSLPPQIMNPSNFRIDRLSFSVNPQEDPYYLYSGGLEKMAPVVNISMEFVVSLPTGEKVSIYYQTSVTSNQYDIPNQ